MELINVLLHFLLVCHSLTHTLNHSSSGFKLTGLNSKMCVATLFPLQMMVQLLTTSPSIFGVGPFSTKGHMVKCPFTFLSNWTLAPPEEGSGINKTASARWLYNNGPCPSSLQFPLQIFYGFMSAERAIGVGLINVCASRSANHYLGLHIYQPLF